MIEKRQRGSTSLMNREWNVGYTGKGKDLYRFPHLKNINVTHKTCFDLN